MIFKIKIKHFRILKIKIFEEQTFTICPKFIIFRKQERKLRGNAPYRKYLPISKM